MIGFCMGDGSREEESENTILSIELCKCKKKIDIYGIIWTKKMLNSSMCEPRIYCDGRCFLELWRRIKLSTACIETDWFDFSFLLDVILRE